MFTEVGRQPWVVHGLLKTENAGSPNLGAGTVLLSLIAFAFTYALLMAADIYLLVKTAKAGPQPLEIGSEAPIPSPVATQY